MDVIETDTAEVQVNSAGATSYVNNYKIMNMLGEGTFSKVYLCQSEAGNEFALKIVNKSILKRKREYKRVDGKLVLSNAFQKVQKEVAIMKKLAHSNLVRLYEVIDSPADDKLFLVLELIRGGQIMYWDDKKFRYFARNTPTGVLSKDTVRECLRDVVAALDFLHRNHICHRDIKPENILLSGRQYKLADFGVAYTKDDEPSVAARAGDAALKLRSTEGTYHFLGPECTTGDEYDPYQVDVWALGVTMHALLLGTLPFGTSVASLSDVMTSIREDPLILPQELDSECAELLTQLMEKDPNLRITVPQLMTHPWISGSGGELNQRQSGIEVLVTQQEIEAAFTPVNNFILVMKLKMKMSTRLNKVRKALASNGKRVDALPVTAHVAVSSTEDGSGELTDPKTMEMAPSEQPQIMTDRLQRRSSRIMESISDTMGSLSTTLTRRKSQLGGLTAQRPLRHFHPENTAGVAGGSLLLNPSRSGEVTKNPGAFPSVIARKEHSPAKVNFHVATLESDAIGTGHSPIRTESTSPSKRSRLSRQNSTSFKALVSTPEVIPDSTNVQSEKVEDGSIRASDAISNGANESAESKSPSKAQSSSSTTLYFRRTSTSFRTLPLKVDTSGAGENVNGTSRTTLGNLSPGYCSSSDPLEVISPRSRGVDELHSLQMSPSCSPIGCPKHKTTAETDVLPLQTLPKSKLPVLEIHSPVSSPVASPAASQTRVADVGETDSNEVTPRRRPSSAGRLSTVKVAPLSRKRSSSFHFDGPLSSSDEGDKNEDPPVSNASTRPTTVVPSPRPSSISLSLPESAAASDRRATFSTTPASPLSEEAKSSPSPHRKLHRNRSASSGLDGDDPTLTRKSSLARALDEYLTSARAADRSVEEAPTATADTPLSPLTPTRRYPVHVPPLPRPEGSTCSSSSKSHESRSSSPISPLESIENPSRLDPKAHLTPEKSTPPPRKKSLVQDSLRFLFRGQNSSMHAVSDSRTNSIESKVCGIM